MPEATCAPRAMWACAALPLMAACTAPLPEGRPAVLGHRFTLGVGGQAFSSYDTELQLNASNFDLGAEIDFEEDLGFDKTGEVLRMDADWRLAPRHGLALSVFNIERNATKSIDREIEFGDTTFPVNARLSTNLVVTVAKLTYRYFFLVRDHWELGASFGLHTLDLDVRLNARVLERDESAAIIAPLPVVGLHGSWALGDRTRLSFIGEVFGIEVDQVAGTLVDTRLTLDHDLGENVGVGIGYNNFLVNVEANRNSFNGDFDWRYDGLMLYLRIFF